MIRSNGRTESTDMSQGVKAEPISDRERVRPSLTDTDRCDACGAKAYYEVELYNLDREEGVLLFCGHHFTLYEEQLQDVAIDIHDHSHELMP